MINTININNNPIATWGDNHGYWNEIKTFLTKHSYKNSEDNSHPESWNIIQVGDFNIGMKPKDIQKEQLDDLNDFLKESKSFLYIIRGNHDDSNYFNGLYKLHYPNIVFVPDYSVLVNDKYKILCIGGATSIDRSYTKKLNIKLAQSFKDYKAYDKNEAFVYNEETIEEILKSFEINVIITHSAPSNFPPIGINDFVREWIHKDDLSLTQIEKNRGLYLYNELQEERNNLNKILLKFLYSNPLKYWFYGHFHDSQLTLFDGKEQLKAIMLNIDEFYEL